MEVSDEDGGGPDGKKMMPPSSTPAMVQPSNPQPAKRKMKTPFQLEHLEKAFADAPFPSEETRAELSMKLALTDRQLQMWFCHRRLKEKKTNSMNAMTVVNSFPKRKASTKTYSHSAPRMTDVRLPSPPPSPLPSPPPALLPSPPPPPPPSPSPSPSPFSSSSSTPPLARSRSNHHKSIVPMQPQTMFELTKIASVKFQLGDEFREDGPFLGTVFDSLPQRAFQNFLGHQNHPEQQSDDENLPVINATKSYKEPLFFHSTENYSMPILSSRKRKGRDDDLNVSCSQTVRSPMYGYHFPSEQQSVHDDGNESLTPPHFSDKHTGGLPMHDDNQKTPCFMNGQLAIKQDSEHVVELEHRRIMWEEETRMEKKRKMEDARIAKEILANEKRMKKELEKQDTLKRKREEQMRKEIERQDRERKKEEDKLLREKQREEERRQRELKREHERREKFLQRENLRAEKIRIKEEMRKEKEAARIKAANEKAAARKIAKEYMDLIEDGRLELMEIAASTKGLMSITSIDSDTLQNLNIFQEMLEEFPPQSVHLKQPFDVRPWIDSNECIGNLLMVWRFLITFADVLSLWPFTLDEFVQALHDYDARLLGEIHISLLKFIVKDIEDAVSSMPPGGNHTSAANPGIGHSQVVVKGAYEWGFDIQRWKNHLNPLTWPEILRQFALCAGFGPQLRKNDETASHCNEDECHDNEDVISALRSGIAAENAVFAMQGRGTSNLHRKRHRLTPGTVKFAAFHVLSLEGNNGLTILEIADKIQKSGLRDLTTSKTPEATISAALSRDTELFVRTAPSTYCVQAAYRKDPADADSILAIAREKMHKFETSYLEMEGAEKDIEGIDGVERDEEFESDDPEIEGVNPEIFFADVPNQCELNYVTKSTFKKEANVHDTEIDESNHGESWIQGLMDGEYSDISVEERLSALVSLVGVALEGNTIRVILEKRMKAAKILKQQLLAEVQLDRKRMKEENQCRLESSSMGMNSEMLQENIANMNGNHNPSFIVGDMGHPINSNPNVNGESIDLENPHNLKGIATRRTMIVQGLQTTPDVCQTQHCRYIEKSQAQIKSYINQKAEQVHPYRSLPLGQDRRHNQYWQFIASASKSDPGSGRIFFESRDGYWRLIDSEEVFDSLLAALDLRGIRESHLHSELLKIEASFKETVRVNKTFYQSFSPDCGLSMDSPDSAVCCFTVDPSDRSSSFYIQLGQSQMEKSCLMKRYHDFQMWMWKNCFNSAVMCALKFGRRRCSEMLGICNICFNTYLSEEKHCSSCHTTFKNRYNFEVIFSEHVACCEQRVNPNTHCSNSSLPIRFQMLKMQLSHIEASIPTEALLPFWTDFYRKSWSEKLQLSSSAEDLFQVLTILESAIKRDYLSPNFETTNELLSISLPVNSMNKVESHSLVVKVLPWIPHTTAAVGLRLMELDASIFYDLDLKPNSPERDSGKLIEPPTSHYVANGIVDSEHMETVGHDNHFSECGQADPRTKHRATCVLATRGRGVSRYGCGGRSTSKGERDKISLLSTRGRKRGSGRRTVRPRKTSESKGREVLGGGTQFGIESTESSEFHGMETEHAHAEVDKVGYHESDDNDQILGDEYYDNGSCYYGERGVVDSESEEESNGDDEADTDYINEDIEGEMDEDENRMNEDEDEDENMMNGNDSDNESYSSLEESD